LFTNSGKSPLAPAELLPQPVIPNALQRADAKVAALGFYTTTGFALAHASARSVIRADAIAGVASSELGVYRGGALLVGDEAVAVRGGIRRRMYPKSKEASDSYRRQVLGNEHRRRYLSPDFMVKQQARTIALLIGKGLSKEQAEAAVRTAAAKRQKVIRRRGPLPTDSPSPINMNRAQAVEDARLELQAEHEAGLRAKRPSARAARLRAARNIAQSDLRLLPADYVGRRAAPSL
jgi:hypothetical protein